MYVQYWRNPNYNFMRIELSIVIALVFSSSFIDAGETEVVTHRSLRPTNAESFLVNRWRAFGAVCLSFSDCGWMPSRNRQSYASPNRTQINNHLLLYESARSNSTLTFFAG